MGLKDELAELNIAASNNRLESIMQMLNTEDRAELVELLEDDSYTARQIAAVLCNRGPRFKISERTIQRYRQQQRGF
jgi:hypothetical protein